MTQGLWSLDIFRAEAEDQMMANTLEVFADITCPFTHVGLKRVVAEIEHLDEDVEIIVRAWPLEWVNGEGLDAAAVTVKIAALRDQLGSGGFAGYRKDTWPASTISPLNLAADAFDVDAATGLAVSIAIRDALFEEGRDVGDPTVLAAIADRFGLPAPEADANERVRADYAEGQRRGVRGSPDFWVGDDEFFCPALTLGHDDSGLTAEFDAEGLDRFLDRVRAPTS